MNTKKNEDIRKAVSERYKTIALSTDKGCSCSPSSCCGNSEKTTSEQISSELGYSAQEMASVPEGSNLGLGCGNPQAIASLKIGETVLDLGSGAGFDCFLAARQVGNEGHVIGVDMTPAMISKAKSNAEKGGFNNVEFRLGEIENLPVADHMIDAIISNCVINMSPDKPRVFAEAFRVLKPGGRLAISDVVAFEDLPEKVKRDMVLYSSCVSGAMTMVKIEKILKKTGFINIRIVSKNESKEFIRDWAPEMPIADYVVSANIMAEKPKVS
jgi:arsenite methyltransferase